jgi:hypothetical protein
MAENFLSNDESIQGKWGPPPKLDAAPIGSTLAAILADKLARDKMVGSDIAGAIKNVMAYRQGNAYNEALRNAGLTQGQDISGLSAGQGTELAKLIQGQDSPDPIEDNYKKALTDESKARAKMYGGGGGDDGDANVASIDETQYPEYRTDPNTNVVSYRHIQRGAHGQLIINYTPINVPLQPTTAQNQSQRQSYQSEKDLENAISMHELRSKIEAQQNTTANKPNTPYSQSADWAVKQAELEKLRQQRMNPPPDDQSGRQQTTMPPQRFGTEQEARAAGHQSGDKIILFDPDTGRYRPYQIP